MLSFTLPLHAAIRKFFAWRLHEEGQQEIIQNMEVISRSHFLSCGVAHKGFNLRERLAIEGNGKAWKRVSTP